MAPYIINIINAICIKIVLLANGRKKKKKKLNRISYGYHRVELYDSNIIYEQNIVVICMYLFLFIVVGRINRKSFNSNVQTKFIYYIICTLSYDGNRRLYRSTGIAWSAECFSFPRTADVQGHRGHAFNNCPVTRAYAV